MTTKHTGTNYLLNKDGVGKSKPSTRVLPEPDHAYGKQDIKDPEGVAEVTRSWQAHNPSNKPQPDTDFKKLNKLSISKKVTTAKDNTMFKKEHCVKLKEKEIVLDKPKILPPESFSYGVPLKPSTPIKKVILHGYAEDGNDEQIKKTQMYEELNKKAPLPGPKPTKASKKVLEATMHKQEDKKQSDFKLGRFKNVQPKTVIGNNALKSKSPAENNKTEETKEAEQVAAQ